MATFFAGPWFSSFGWYTAELNWPSRQLGAGGHPGQRSPDKGWIQTFTRCVINRDRIMVEKLILLPYFILEKLNKLSLSSPSLIIYKKNLSGIWYLKKSILSLTFKPIYTHHKIQKKEYIFAKYFFLLSYYIKIL